MMEFSLHRKSSRYKIGHVTLHVFVRLFRFYFNFTLVVRTILLNFDCFNLAAQVKVEGDLRLL